MNFPWDTIAAAGSVLTILAVAPFLLGMVGLALNFNMQTANLEMLAQVVNLFTTALLAMVPISFVGVIVVVFFQLSEEMA